MNRLIGFLCVVVSFLALPLHASAQVGYLPRGYPVPVNNPYYPGYSPGYGYGNFLSGAADVNRSFGDLAVSNEQARIMREQSNQAKLDNKKKAFDLMMYEKAHTLTYTETLTRDQGQILTRMINFPTRSEITNGVSLNTLLPYMQSLSTNGTQGPPIPVPRMAVEALNVSSDGLRSVGLLRNGGQVEWPLGLRGPQQKKLDQLLPAAYKATLSNSLDPKLMKQIRTEMTTMHNTLRTRLQKEEIETSTYMQAIEFFSFLESTMIALARPDARKYLDGTYAVRGRNVQEVVDFMSDSGLKFAPACPGSENAYQAVQDSFVRYARTAQSSSGMQTLNAPVRKK